MRNPYPFWLELNLHSRFRKNLSFRVRTTMALAKLRVDLEDLVSVTTRLVTELKAENKRM